MLSHKSSFSVEWPTTVSSLTQDQEWCWLDLGGKKSRLRLHDYSTIYQVPGLYESLFYEHLACQSPQVVTAALQQTLYANGVTLADLPVLDIGAGNGMMGEALRAAGAQYIDAIDILPAAAAAADRDRPGVYQHYYVTDLTSPSAAAWEHVSATSYRCLTTVAALGFNDIPPIVFATAYNLIDDQGWIAFNIRDTILDGYEPEQTSLQAPLVPSYKQLVPAMLKHGLFKLYCRERYQHRLAVTGEGLFYWALVGRKLGEIPQTWLTVNEATSNSN